MCQIVTLSLSTWCRWIRRRKNHHLLFRQRGKISKNITDLYFTFFFSCLKLQKGNMWLFIHNIAQRSTWYPPKDLLDSYTGTHILNCWIDLKHDCLQCLHHVSLTHWNTLHNTGVAWRRLGWMIGGETSLWFGLANKSTPVKVSKRFFETEKRFNLKHSGWDLWNTGKRKCLGFAYTLFMNPRD